MISDIKEEKDENDIIKYRYIQDIQDPLQDIEKSKSLLTIEQLRVFITEIVKKSS